MPKELRDKKTGAIIFESTSEEKKAIDLEKRLKNLEKKFKLLEEKVDAIIDK